MNAKLFDNRYSYRVASVLRDLIARSLNVLDGVSPRIVVPSLALLAIFVRLLFIFAAPDLGDPNSMDAQNYLNLAHNLADGRGFTLWNKPSIFVPPLYPAVLAGLRLLGYDSLWAIKAFQAVLGGVMVWLVYLLGRGISQQGVAYVASAIFAFHPEMIALSAFIYTEIVFIFLLLLFLLLVNQAVQTWKCSNFLFAGMLLGVTNLCRSTLLYFPIFLLLLVLFYRDGFRRRRIIGVVVLAFAATLTMLPWTIRNYLHVHAIVPVAIGGGDVFWAGNYLPFDGEFRYEETDKRIEELVGNNATLVERDRILMAEAKKNIMAQPVQAMQLFFRKIFRFWLRVYDNVPTGKVRATNWVIVAALGFAHFALLALAAVGIWQLKMKKPFVAVMLALLLYYTLIHAATLAVPRYRQPLIPVLCICAAVGLFAIQKNWH